MKTLIRWILKLLYRVEIKGLEHYRAAGKRVLLVANHVSFLDPPLISAFLPDKLMFAVNTHVAKRWWLKPMLSLVDSYQMDPTNPMATKSLIEAIKEDRKCLIFPEGRITTTGSLMKIYEGPGVIAEKSGAKILPIRIEGAQYTPLSRLSHKVRRRWFPKITLTILPPRELGVSEDIKGKARRQAVADAMYDIMSDLMFASTDVRKTLFGGLIDNFEKNGRGHIIAEDIERTPITNGQLLTRCFVLGRLLARDTAPGEYVGVLLPNMVSTIVTFFGLQAYGRVPAMLNYSAGERNLLSACATAKITRVYTSRKFIEAANLGAIEEKMVAAGVTVSYLEDLRGKVNAFTKLYGLIASFAPKCFYRSQVSPDAPAVVLFTSGSEGVPKGVVLSHANILSNIAQLAARVDFGASDVVFNALPVFHSFGLTGGTLLPMMTGIRTFFYPSPLHYRVVPEVIYDTNATILFGTDTFLAGYAKFAHEYDFYSLRYAFAGAEKLKEETRLTWLNQFGVRVFQGYGATETAPVVAVNTPMHHRPGTVGRLLPGMEFKIAKVEGIEEGGKLIVKGPNIMIGYLLSANPGVLVPPPEGWYDTGDIVSVDAEGYIAIKGRTKRFAKISGEMISLAAVEDIVSIAWPGEQHAVISMPDAKKGEQLVLLTTKKDAAREDLIAHGLKQGMPALSIPKVLLVLEALPLLATGKVDYVSIKEYVEKQTLPVEAEE